MPSTWAREILEQVFEDGLLNELRTTAEEIIRAGLGSLPRGGALIDSADLLDAITDLIEGSTEKAADQTKDALKERPNF
ncbi:MAG: hypothetical protein D6816_07140 [Bacteroidetes bacterium]|nr:MAG: hypothetical protein D6816_07140 [Bacteroidota bacterium]